MRPSSEQQRAALKAAFRQALKRAGGGDNFCAATRVAPAQLSRYCSVDHPDFPPADILLDLDLDLGEPLMAASLARAQGFELRPAGTPDPAADMEGAAAGMVADAANTFSGLRAALADGRLSEGERRELLALLLQLQAGLMTLLRGVTGGA